MTSTAQPDDVASRTLTLHIVPEPATAMLVAAGLAGLGVVRSRYRVR